MYHSFNDPQNCLSFLSIVLQHFCSLRCGIIIIIIYIGEEYESNDTSLFTTHNETDIQLDQSGKKCAMRNCF